MQLYPVPSWRLGLWLLVLLLFWYFCRKSCPSSVDIIGLRVPTRTLRDFPLFHVSTSVKVVPLPGVPLLQIRLVAILISSEGKLLHSVRFNFTLTLCRKVS
jgi:hypothetical protein